MNKCCMKYKTFEDLMPDSTVSIYGAGKAGIKIMEKLGRERTDIKILNFFDSEKDGALCGLPVVKFQNKTDIQCDVILICSNFRKEIEDKLKKLNIGNYMVMHPDLYSQAESFLNMDKSKKIGRFWSDSLKNNNNAGKKLRWWESSLIIKHINKLVSGEECLGFSQGLLNKIKESYGKYLPFEKGISVGCGTGAKEMNLIRQNIVSSFELFEFSEERISSGVEAAKKSGIEDRVCFKNGNAFEEVKEAGMYDFVYWNNSLHHMPDVSEAVKWSKKILRKNGLFVMDDFVGPSRFQWSDEALDIASKVRAVFKDSKYLTNPKDSINFLSTAIKRPNKEALIERDPSEAEDSERIPEEVKKHFPDAEIIKTGGTIYNLTLADMINNFDEKKQEDKLLLDLLMIIDELCIDKCETHYAVALGVK